ncbi:hypothetical protein [Bradyrhizobium sp. ORS 86]|uniref:hypothetical protein n=1 Tax=Bradyrhizobium sp. ORS 86 TaxID=1685970 RepID=UPI00388D3C9F
MSIPAAITAELANLQAQVKAASPLSSASRPIVLAMQLNAAQLVADVQAALVAPSVLDSWVAPSDPAAIVTGVLGVSVAAEDASNLSLMRGVVGRVASNLDQLV